MNKEWSQRRCISTVLVTAFLEWAAGALLLFALYEALT
jgi:hypothetical protein